MPAHLGRARVVLPLLLAVIVAALATGTPPFFRAAYVLGVALVAAYVWGALALRGLDVHLRHRGIRGQVGDTFGVQAVVINVIASSRPPVQVAIQTSMPGLKPGRVISLGGYSSEIWTTYIRAGQRGVFTLGPLVLTAHDPFGLFHHQRRFAQAQEVLVYPATVPLPNFSMSRHGVPEEGALRRPSPHTSPNAASVRQYVPGDTLSRIHWPTTARTGHLMIKQFDEDMGNDVWLLLDLRGEVQAGDGPESTAEYAVTVAASIAKRFLPMGFAVGVLGFGETPLYVPSGRGTSHLEPILEALARTRAEGTVPLAEMLERARRPGGGYRNAVIITPEVTPGWVESASSVFRHWDRITCILLDSPSFGGEGDAEGTALRLASGGARSFIVRRGQPIAEALSTPAARHRHASPEIETVEAPA